MRSNHSQVRELAQTLFKRSVECKQGKELAGGY
jgi:hypothetical protein